MNLEIGELIEAERVKWSEFMGDRIDHSLIDQTGQFKIAQPTEELVRVLDRTKELGIDSLDPHFIPCLSFGERTIYPGWGMRPAAPFWSLDMRNNLTFESYQLGECNTGQGGYWILFDRTPKPDYESDNQQMYSNDPFSEFLTNLREEGRLDIHFYEFFNTLPTGSRFGLDFRNINDQILPRIKELLGVAEANVRLPKFLEFNLMGNLHYQYLGDSNSVEWLGDKTNFPDSAVFGGSTENGGLPWVSYTGSLKGDPRTGFRPVITFPTTSYTH